MNKDWAFPVVGKALFNDSSGYTVSSTGGNDNFLAAIFYLVTVGKTTGALKTKRQQVLKYL